MPPAPGAEGHALPSDPRNPVSHSRPWEETGMLEGSPPCPPGLGASAISGHLWAQSCFWLAILQGAGPRGVPLSPSFFPLALHPTEWALGASCVGTHEVRREQKQAEQRHRSGQRGQRGALWEIRASERDREGWVSWAGAVPKLDLWMSYPGTTEYGLFGNRGSIDVKSWDEVTVAWGPGSPGDCVLKARGIRTQREGDGELGHQ